MSRPSLSKSTLLKGVLLDKLFPVQSPITLPEALVGYSLIGTYCLYLIGAQFVWIPFLAWLLLGYLVLQWWQESDTPCGHKIVLTSPIWVWLVAVVGILFALLMGHLDFDLGLSWTVKSFINRWIRQWALLALFPMIGALSIRPQVIYRAVCILCLQNLVAAILAFVVVFVLKRPDPSFLSPFNAFGGGEIFYSVDLWGTSVDNGTVRMALIAPWSPALGLIGNIYFFLAFQEKNAVWRWVGMAGALAMIVGSLSRLAIVCLPLMCLISWLLHNLSKAWVLFLLSVVSLCSTLLFPQLMLLLETLSDQFTRLRPGSSRTRNALQEIALDRWWQDAPIWGHGTIEPKGPRIVGFMPIGTHHMWVGMLYMHGIVGFFLLSGAFIWSFITLAIRSLHSDLAKQALILLCILLLFSFGENLESLAYMYWPSLIIMGLAYREPINPVSTASNLGI